MSCNCNKLLSHQEAVEQNVEDIFEVHVKSEDFKFSSAHFVAFENFREKIHGHNYTVELKLGGPVGSDGYVVDFGIMKKLLRKLCKELNEHLLVPELSNVLVFSKTETNLQIDAWDGSHFSFPLSDCIMLPIKHTTAEELAQYLTDQIFLDMGEFLKERKIKWTEVTVCERPTQGARCLRRLN